MRFFCPSLILMDKYCVSGEASFAEYTSFHFPGFLKREDSHVGARSTTSRFWNSPSSLYAEMGYEKFGRACVGEFANSTWNNKKFDIFCGICVRHCHYFLSAATSVSLRTKTLVQVLFPAEFISLGAEGPSSRESGMGRRNQPRAPREKCVALSVSAVAALTDIHFSDVIPVKVYSFAHCSFAYSWHTHYLPSPVPHLYILDETDFEPCHVQNLIIFWMFTA